MLSADVLNLVTFFLPSFPSVWVTGMASKILSAIAQDKTLAQVNDLSQRVVLENPLSQR